MLRHVKPALAPATLAALAVGAPRTSQAAPALPAAPLSLADAVHLAQTRNERARIADLQIDVAEAGVERARGAFLPILTLAGSDQQRPSPDKPENVGQASLTLSQPLLNASAWPLYGQAKRTADAQHAQSADDQRLLTFDAARAFLAVLTADEVVQAAKRQLDNAAANLADAQARAQAQLASSNDVTRAQLDLSSAGREVELDQGVLDNAYVQLGFVVVAPVTGPLVAPADTLQAAQGPIPALPGLVTFALDHRPDVLAGRYAVAAAHDFADEPLLRLVPTVGLQGQATATTNAPATTNRTTDESLTATLTWTLYDSGVRYADKHSRDAQAAIAELNLAALARSVDAGVRSAAALLQASQGAFRVAGQAVAAARQNAEESAILYRQGLAKAIELVDANDSRFTAEVSYANAEYAMAQAYLNLRQALGLDPLGTELR
jgi:outer membrane protein TolC